MIEIIYQLLLMLPTVVEIVDDKGGDAHTDNKDVRVRIILVLAMSFIVAGLHGLFIDNSWKVFYTFIPKSLALSVGYFCGFFSYGVNFVQRHLTDRSDWWAYLNKKSWPDNWSPWRKIGWIGRMIVSLGLFLASLIFYIL